MFSKDTGMYRPYSEFLVQEDGFCMYYGHIEVRKMMEGTVPNCGAGLASSNWFKQRTECLGSSTIATSNYYAFSCAPGSFLCSFPFLVLKRFIEP